MSLKTETRTVAATPERTIESHVGFFCDFCGADSTKTAAFRDGDKDGATLRHSHKEVFPGTGSVSREVVDCCTDCWKTVVKPWLAEKNITPRIEEFDW